MDEQKKDKVVGSVYFSKVATAAALRQNPGAEKPPETEKEEYEKKTGALKAKAEFAATADALSNPESVQRIREQREKELVDAANKARADSDEAANRERKRLEDDKTAAENAAAAEQQKREAAEAALRAQKDQALLDKLNELQTSRKPLSEQFAEYFAFVDTITEKLGLPKVGTRTPEPAGDPRIALEIERLKIEDNQKQREHDLKMSNDKKEWDLKLMQFQRDGEFKNKELELQAKKADQIFQLPQVLGAAIAQGLMKRSGEGVNVGQKQQPPQNFHIEIPVGEAGSIPCPNCQTQIGVGPEQTLAKCIKCQAEYPITRIGTSFSKAPVEPPLTYEEEDK